MKAFTMGALVAAGLVVSANALPGLHRFSSGQEAHGITAVAHVKTGHGGISAHGTDASVKRAPVSGELDFGLGPVSVDTDTFAAIDASLAGSVDGSTSGSVDGSLLGSVDGSTYGTIVSARAPLDIPTNLAGGAELNLLGVDIDLGADLFADLSVDGSATGSVDGSVDGTVVSARAPLDIPIELSGDAGLNLLDLATVDLVADVAADLSVDGSTDGSADDSANASLDSSASIGATASIGGLPLDLGLDASLRGLIGGTNAVDSTQDSVNKIVDSTQGSVNKVTDSTQGSVNKVVDSTQDSVKIVDSAEDSVNKIVDSTQGSVNKVADSTRGAVDVAGSTQAFKKPDPVFTVGPDSKLRPFSTKFHSVSTRPIIPTPSIIPPGVFPRGEFGVFGSSGSGYKSSTVAPEISGSPSSTVGVGAQSHGGIKAVSPGFVLGSSGSTESVVMSAPASTPSVSSTLDLGYGLTQASLILESTTKTTSTITQSTTRTVTQLIALNPSYKDPSANSSTDGPCRKSTVTITVVATNVVASPSVTAKYVNVTTAVNTGVAPSTLTTSAVDPCKLPSLPGFVGMQLPSGSQVGGSCTVGPVTTSSTGGGSQTSSSALPFSTSAVGTNNVNVAFLVGFAALAIFV